jgi:hypothetical protein
LGVVYTFHGGLMVIGGPALRSGDAKTELAAQPDPQIVAIHRFFDGNDDVGSIACNLLEHPAWWD